jgi:hypothetical protein
MDMASDSDAAWNVPQPYLRLWLTLALGLLGMFLFPFGEGFAPDAFAHVHRLPLFVWMTAAFGGVLLIHRAERWSMPGAQALLMDLVLALSLLVSVGVGEKQQHWGQSLGNFYWLCFLLLLLIMGASAARPRSLRESGTGSLRESLLRGPAIALTAPLLLYASRPVGSDGPSSGLHRLSGAVLSALPHVLAAGFALPFFLSVCRYDKLASGVGLMWQSFTVWAWIGCALLFVLSPWPAHPRVVRRDDLTQACKRASLATIALVAILLFQKVVLREFVLFLMFFHPAFIWGGVGCVLALVLVPWPEYPALPRLGALSTARKMGPLDTVLFLTLALVALGSFAWGPFIHIVSGQLFANTFNPDDAVGGLDQPSLSKWFFLFALFSATVLPYVAAARWMSNRESRWGYWAFAIPAVALCLCLLSILTLPFYGLIQYIGEMGCTVRRLLGLEYGLTGYGAVLAFLCWAVWPPRKEEKA